MNITKKRLTQIIKEEVSRISELETSSPLDKGPGSVSTLGNAIKTMGMELAQNPSGIQISSAEAQVIYDMLQQLLKLGAQPGESTVQMKRAGGYITPKGTKEG